jgi:hypothetical protein
MPSPSVKKPSKVKGQYPQEKRRWSMKLSLLFLVAITISSIAPFANKAFHIDDPLFLWAAKHIQSHPTDPYGFKVTWYYDEMEMSEITKNPPFISYYIALVAFLVGWGKRPLTLPFLFRPLPSF